MGTFVSDGGDGRHIPAIVARIRSEYTEMPGLCLTPPQAQRLLGLDALTCDSVLAGLTDAGYLRLTARGYMRA